MGVKKGPQEFTLESYVKLKANEKNFSLEIFLVFLEGLALFKSEFSCTIAITKVDA